MSVRLMVEVLDHAPRDLPDVGHRALIAMAERMHDTTRTGYHPRAELAHRISRSERSTRRVLSDLVDRGLLAVVKKAGRSRSTVYRMAPLAPDGRGPLLDADPEKEATQDGPLSDGDPHQKEATQDGPLSGQKEAKSRQKEATQDGPPSRTPSLKSSPRAPAREDPPTPPPADATPDDERSTSDDPAATAAMVTLREHTNRTITHEHAHRVAHTILNGRTVTDPAAYVRHAITRDPDRHLPAALPPHVTDTLRHPDAPEDTPRSTRERPAHVTDTLAALRAQWAQPTAGGTP